LQTKGGESGLLRKGERSRIEDREPCARGTYSSWGRKAHRKKKRVLPPPGGNGRSGSQEVCQRGKNR